MQAIEWLASGQGRQLWKSGGDEGKEEGEGGIILAGHSSGATLCMHAAPRLGSLQQPRSATRVRAVVGLAGVYDFIALRDAHLGAKAIYDEINTGVFGPEKRDSEGEWAGGWERGKIHGGEWRAEGVEVVVLGHGRADKMVDMGQAEGFVKELEDGGGAARRGGGKEPVVRVVECEGAHDEIVDAGKEVGRCVGVALEVLLGGEQKGTFEGR